MNLAQIDPVALSIGSLQLRWYGLMYLAGFGLGWMLGRWRASRPGSGWTGPDVDDLLTCVMIGIILGGRIGYVLFYDLPVYTHDPMEIVRMERRHVVSWRAVGRAWRVLVFCPHARQNFSGSF